MRVLILYANPSEKSFGAALHKKAVETLRSRGHYVDDCDLYAEGFDPVMSRQEREHYHDPSVKNGRREELHGPPTGGRGARSRLSRLERRLSGDSERILRSGFHSGRKLQDGIRWRCDAKPWDLQKLAAVCTYGANRLSTFLLGDPPRRVVKRLVRAMPGHSITCSYLALYDMNRIPSEGRAAFLNKVERAFQTW
jgi:NAD(P)H dehydrogenase (quinone)